MKENQGNFIGKGGIELFFQSWQPEEKPDKVIVIVHGMDENCSHYHHLVDYFVARRIGVYGYDLRGYGRSGGQEGHIDHFSDYREDLGLFLDQVHLMANHEHVYLFCHSLGALIGLDYLEHHSKYIHGAVISGAPLEPVGVGSPFTIFMAKIMSGIFPRFSMDLGVDYEVGTRDEIERQAMKDDPLYRSRVTARWGTECMRTVKEVKANVKKIRTPLLLVHGEADKVNHPNGSKGFFDSLVCPDKAIKTYPGAYHNIHADLDWELEMKDVEEWMIKHP